MSTHAKPRLLRRTEVANLLGVHPRTLDRLVRTGALPAVHIDRMPRFLPEDVDELIRSRRQAGGCVPEETLADIPQAETT